MQGTNDAGQCGGAVLAISASASSVSSGTVVFSNSNNVSFGMSGSTVTASAVFSQTVEPAAAIAAGTQTATSGTVVFANSNSITFGMLGSSQVTASFSATQSTAPSAISAAGSSASSGTVVFSNSNNVSFGMNGNTITATASASQSTAPSAIAAGTQTATSGTVVFSNSNNFTFGMSGSSRVTVSYAPSVNYLELGTLAALGNAVVNSGSSNVSLFRAQFPVNITATRLDLIGNLTVAGSTQGTYTFAVGIYTFSGSTASLASTGSVSVSFTTGAGGAASVYGGQSAIQYRTIPLGGTWNISSGPYMMAMLISQDNPAGTTGGWSFFGAASINMGRATNGTDVFGHGMLGTASSTVPNSFQVSDNALVGSNNFHVLYMRFLGT